jgi:hypothetical protein
MLKELEKERAKKPSPPNIPQTETAIPWFTNNIHCFNHL